MPNKRIFYFLSVFFALIANANAVDYPKGHQALEVFDAQGMEATPQWVMFWIIFMVANFAAGLFFIRRHPIARWVVGSFIAGMLALSISEVLGIVQLSGFIALLHLVFWSPALYQLLTKRPFLTKKRTVFSIWSAVITLVILLSFVFDIRDSIIYLNHIF